MQESQIHVRQNYRQKQSLSRSNQNTKVKISSHELNMDLIEAVMSENDVQVDQLLQQEYYDVNYTDKHGNNCLHLAGKASIVSKLIGASCQVNTQNADGDTPLHMWSKFHTSSRNPVFNFDERRRIMAKLIEAGADCNIQNNDGYTVLHTVFVYGGIAGLDLTEEQIVDLVTLLIVSGKADSSIPDLDLHIPLHHAITEPYITPLEMLLQSGCCVNSGTIWGGTALHFLTNTDEDARPRINLLLENGINTKIQDIQGRTCLHYAAGHGNVSLVTLVLEHENKKAFSEDSEGSEASRTSRKASSSVNLQDQNGVAPLHVSAAFKQVEITEILIQNHADVNAVDKYGATSLHYGAYGGTIEIVKMLVDAGTCVDKVDSNGWTAEKLALSRHYYHTAIAINPNSLKMLKPQITDSHLKIKNVDILQSFPGDDIFNIHVQDFRIYSDPFDISHIERELLEEMCLKFRGDFQRYVEGMMQVTGIGRIPEIKEVVQIQNAIENFISKQVSCIADVDSRFKGTIIHSGSWYEGTKVGDPDEFDFMLCLNEFGKECKIASEDKEIYDVSVSRYGSDPRFDIFFKDDKLQSDILMERFIAVAKQAFCNMQYETGSSSLYFEGVTGHTLVEATWPVSGTVTCELKFVWTGQIYKQLVITTDLVPAILVNTWPSFADCEDLTTDMKAHGCHVVPKSGTWRLSFSVAEKIIFESLCEENKLAYIGAKVALHPAVTARFFILSNEQQLSLEEDDIQEGFCYRIVNMVEEPDTTVTNVSEVPTNNEKCFHNDDGTSPQLGREFSTKTNTSSVDGSCQSMNTTFDLDHSSDKIQTLSEIIERKRVTQTEPSGEYQRTIKGHKIATSRSPLGQTVTVLQLEDTYDIASREFFSTVKEGDSIALRSSLGNEDFYETVPLDGRSLIPSYLLKLILFNCIENSKKTQGTEEPVTTAQIFHELKRCLETQSPVPFFFCRRNNFLQKVINAEEIKCEVSFLVTFIDHLFQNLNQYNTGDLTMR